MEELNEIIEEITAGLSGDDEADLAYLKEQIEKYKDDPYAKEILRECGRMMVPLLSEESSAAFEQTLKEDLENIELQLQEIRQMALAGEMEEALAHSEKLVAQVEESTLFENDSVSEYFVFDNLFEEILYDYYHEPEKALKRPTIPYNEIYYTHGNILFELHRVTEAREYLKKALRWNPASCVIAFEYIETFKAEGRLDAFYVLSIQQFKYAFRAKDVARCYRNLGYFYIEREKYDVAAACYVMSLFYDEGNPIAEKEMTYIKMKAGDDFEVPDLDQISKFEEAYGIPASADPEVIGLVSAYAQKANEEKEIEFLVYFLDILCDLTKDEEYIEILNDLKMKLASATQE